jgi:hypothetical protein
MFLAGIDKTSVLTANGMWLTDRFLYFNVFHFSLFVIHFSLL